MRDQRLNSLGQIITAAENSKYERNFFAPATLKAWRSRVSESVYPTFGPFGTVFVTSERDSGRSEESYGRFYTVRRAYWDEYDQRERGAQELAIENVSESRQFKSRGGAHAYAKRVRLLHLVPRDDGQAGI